MFKKRSILLIITSFFVLASCSKDNNSKEQTKPQGKEDIIAQKSSEKIAPEDDPALKGTPVLGFKWLCCTNLSVKAFSAI